VVTRHRVLLAAFLMQSHRPPGAAWPQILDLHLQRCIDTREAVGEGGDQCPVAQIAQCHVRDRLEQLAHSVPSSTGVLPAFTTCFGPRTAAGLVGTTWPITSHGGELLLDGWRRDLVLQLLYI
jgi:hypothetical protein